MEGETRANVNYLEQLYKFHRLHGHPINKVPQLDKRPIDLFRLKKEVARRGGYQKASIIHLLNIQAHHVNMSLLGNQAKKVGRNWS